MLALAAEVRVEIADFLSALLMVYVICLISWIVVSLVFSLGVRMPYNRPVIAVVDFLRDVSEPYLRPFRKIIPMIGPLDISPIVAILVLQIVGFSIIVPLIDG